ncbi:uncharacterized protein LOC129693390, partial [Leucoraja erinacea]|uniref:uncharacterized protein LOC129693390 n=1 Tax=Leucoraja erinaceus TaxID=7782 RepID=UPI002457051F
SPDVHRETGGKTDPGIIDLENPPRNRILSQWETHPQIHRRAQLGNLKEQRVEDSGQGLASDPSRVCKLSHPFPAHPGGIFSRFYSHSPISSFVPGPEGAGGEGHQESTTGEPSGAPPTAPKEETCSGPECAGGEEHKESTTRVPRGAPSTVPKEETCSAPWMLTDEECERLISEVQVLFIGDQDLGSPEDMKAYLQELRKMLRKQLPCKQDKS